MLRLSDNKQGLCVEDINGKDKMLLDADNVFWAINRQCTDNLLIPRNVLSLYEKTKDSCDEELRQFRFDAELSAIYIDPTDRCNACCPYCYVPMKTRREGKSMTQAELDQVLEKIAAYFSARGKIGADKKPVVIFHASEPLLVKDILFKAIEKFRNYFHFGIQTNALLLEKEDAEFIKKNNVSIGISLDAADKAVNNRLRLSPEGGNFQKAIKALEWFRGYRGLNVITTITKLNVAKLPGLVRFLHKKEVNCVLINPVRLTQKNSRALRPDDAVMAKYFIQAVDTAIKLSEKSRHKIIVGNFANVLLAIIAPTARRLMCDISPCGGGRCFFTITASGEMIPCGEFIGLTGFSGGNIFKDSIDSAMDSAAFKQIRGRFVEKIAECDVCALRNICGAPCPAELHALGGMYKKSVFCEFYKEVIKYAFKIIAAGKEKCCFRNEGFKNMQFQYRLGD